MRLGRRGRWPNSSATSGGHAIARGSVEAWLELLGTGTGRHGIQAARPRGHKRVILPQGPWPGRCSGLQTLSTAAPLVSSPCGKSQCAAPPNSCPCPCAPSRHSRPSCWRRCCSPDAPRHPRPIRPRPRPLPASLIRCRTRTGPGTWPASPPRTRPRRRPRIRWCSPAAHRYGCGPRWLRIFLACRCSTAVSAARICATRSGMPTTSRCVTGHAES